MKRIIVGTFLAVGVLLGAGRAFGLSAELARPEIFFPKGYDTNRAEAIQAVLRSEKFKYLGGMTSYWPPKWATTLVYGGDAEALNAFIGALNGVKGVQVSLTFSPDLSKETRNLRTGSWWVEYSHTRPDTIMVRLNLAAEALGKEKFELTVPKAQPPA